MKSLVITAGLLLAPAIAAASDHASLHVAFAAPPTLAAIQPGVQVVVDNDEEIFYAGQYYWIQRDGGWYHAHHHADAFTYVDNQYVPTTVVNLGQGHYRHYHPGAHHGQGHHGGSAYLYDGYGPGYGGDGSCGH